MKRPGWRRLSPPNNKTATRWLHAASGWEVWHCGHPTANWPYAATDPAELHPAHLVASSSGRGWRTIAQAMDDVEGLLAGRLVLVYDGPTKHGLRSVIIDPNDPPPWLDRGAAQQAIERWRKDRCKTKRRQLRLPL